MEKVKIQPDYPRGVTFEQVWAALMETDRIVKDVAKRQEETARIVRENAERQKEEAERQKKETERLQKENAERQKETAERQKETAQQMKETDRQIKEFNKRFGDFTNRFGEVVEYMVAPNLREKFREMGLVFQETTSNTEVSDHTNQIFLEIDILLKNGDKAMLVEVKTKLTATDVKEHVKRLFKMRSYADLHNDKRKFLGTVAGVVMTSQVKKFALEQGFYVVEPSGETFTITSPAGKPKEW